MQNLADRTVGGANMVKRKHPKTNDGESLGFREKLWRKLDIPPDCLGKEPLIEIRGRGEVTVRGCGKILVYTPEEIRLCLHDGYVSVVGSRLVCTSYYVGAVGIEGKIHGISFEEGEV